jgi:hypothetical protein
MSSPKETMKKIIRDRIKFLRKLKGINQATLGIEALHFTKDEMNAAQKVIGKIEIGERDISVYDCESSGLLLAS